MTRHTNKASREVDEHEGAPATLYLKQLCDILRVLRDSNEGMTRLDLERRLSIGRNALEARLGILRDAHLVVPAGRALSTGGRAPVVWRFNQESGTVLVANISIRTTTVALTSLDGTVLHRETVGVGLFGPEAGDLHASQPPMSPQEVCDKLIQHLEVLQRRTKSVQPIWGLSITVPMPVDVAGRIYNPVSLTTGEKDMWTAFPIKEFFVSRMRVPVWIEDEVDAMAYCASLRPGAPRDLLYVRFSLGIGLGIVSGGKLHRGTIGASGEVAHIQIEKGGDKCRCGRRGCLETFVSGAAFEHSARNPEVWMRSPFLSEAHARSGSIFMEDVFAGIAAGDVTCTKMAADAGIRLASVLAVLVATYNPGEIVIGGAVTASGQLFASIVDQAIRRKVLRTTSARLSVRMGSRDQLDRLVGASQLLVSSLLTPAHVSGRLGLEGDSTLFQRLLS